jgi:hypothetical protein
MNKLKYLPLLLVLVSCIGESRNVTIDLSEESLEWLSEEETGESFYMQDNNGISQSFLYNTLTASYSYSSSSFLGIRTKSTRRQNIYQEWSSSYGRYFSLMLTADFEPFGDNLTVTLNDMSFNYDLGKEEVTRISTPFGSLSKLITSTGYEEPDVILSQVTIHDFLLVGTRTYGNVMHFRLNDFSEKLTPLAITDIWIARHVGLVKFSLSNGLVYTRL